MRVGPGEPGEAVYLRVADLEFAIDGPSQGRRAYHIEARGSLLYARALGGCQGCSVRVNRGVVISSRLRDIEGAPHVPLGDVVQAFEGRLEERPGKTVYVIHAGACRWCILEPNGVA